MKESLNHFEGLENARAFSQWSFSSFEGMVDDALRLVRDTANDRIFAFSSFYFPL